MKKLIALLMVLSLSICICACANSSVNNNTSKEESPSVLQDNSEANESTTLSPQRMSSSAPEAKPQEKSPAPSKHVHKYKETITKEPSCTRTGQIIYNCSCGDSYTVTLDALDHNFSSRFCSQCGTDILSLCSVSSIKCPNQLTYHFTNPYGVTVRSHPLKSLSVSNVYFEYTGDDVYLHLTLNGTVYSNVDDGDGFGYVVLGGDGSAKTMIPASSNKYYSQEFIFTNITPGSYTISIEDFYHYS